MFKKLLFPLVSSAMAFSVFETNTFAVYEGELCEVISKSLARQTKDTSEKDEGSVPKEPSYWEYVTPLASSLGGLLRTGGDYLRRSEVVAELVTEHTKDSLKGTTFGGVSSDKVIEKVEAKEGALDSVFNTVGNSLRWCGACLQEPSETLPRDLRKFWITGKKVADRPDIVFPSTATALIMKMNELSGPDGVALEYIKFVNSWNSSSYSVHEKREEYVHEYFIKGLLGALARTDKEFESFDEVAPVLLAFKLDLDNLVMTQKITAETIFPNKDERNEKSGSELAEAIRKARMREFMDFAGQEIQLVRARLKLQDSASILFPSLKEAPPVLALEYKKDDDSERDDDHDNNE